MSNKALIVSGIIILLLGVLYYTYQGSQEATESSNTNQPAQTMENVTELQTEILKEGTGEAAKAGDEVTVHYVGTLTNGTKFDSSRDRGTPFTFSLGAGQVIQGWDVGVAGMKVGELRRLTIPAAMAYGDRSVGTIPAGSTLVFEVELLGVN